MLENECRTGKACFPDKPSAERSMRYIQTKGDRKQSTPVRSYRCPSCRFWHLTSDDTYDEWWN